MPLVIRTAFLSSTAGDLQPHRDAVKQAVDRLRGWRCVGMEDFGAQNAAPLDVCLAELRACDLFVGLIGHHHGSQPPNSDLSFTEHEYEDALSRDIARLIFLADRAFPVPADLRESDVKWSRQQALRTKAGVDRAAVHFTEDAEALANRVVQSIHNWEQQNPFSPAPRP